MTPASMLRVPAPDARLGVALRILAEAAALFRSGDDARRAEIRRDPRLPLALDAVHALAGQPVVHHQAGLVMEAVGALCAAVSAFPWRDSHLVARAALPWLRLLHGRGGVGLPQLAALVPPLWDAIWSSADRLERFMDFDPFVDLIAAVGRARLGGELRPPAPPAAGREYRIAYVTPFVQWDAGTSSGTHSLARAHASMYPGHKVFVHVLKDESEELRAHYRGNPAILRFDCDLMSAFGRMAGEGVDAILVDSYFWPLIATMACRPVPVQAVLDMTHVYGNLPEVDWWFIGSGDYRRRLGHAGDNLTEITFERELGTIRPADREGAAAIRAELGWSDHVVLGFIGRLVKFSPELAALAAAALRRNPSARLMICGGGDPTLAAALADQPDLQGRVALFNQVVDVSRFGPAIDVFLDSHPFTGGETCREAASYGVPIVTMGNPDFAPLIARGRDPDLVAVDDDDYLLKVDRLLADPDWRRRKAADSAEMARRRCDMAASVGIIVGRIEELIDQKRR